MLDTLELPEVEGVEAHEFAGRLGLEVPGPAELAPGVFGQQASSPGAVVIE